MEQMVKGRKRCKDKKWVLCLGKQEKEVKKKKKVHKGRKKVEEKGVGPEFGI